MTNQAMESQIQSLLNELFKLIGIDVEVNVTPSQEGEETIYKVELDPGSSSGLLIGSHGMTLSSIQSFVTIALKQQTGDWVKVSVDISGWSEKQNTRLAELAQQTAERAKQTREEQKLYNLNPQARRIIHMTLAEDKEIETTSEGEGQDRYLIVRPK
jgi:spoIIIJ-associated protein